MQYIAQLFHGPGQEFHRIVNLDNSKLGKRKDLISEGLLNHAAVMSKFINTWDPTILNAYYQSKTLLVAPQFFIPSIPSRDALKAFGVEKEVKPSHFVIHYKGTIQAPKNGSFRFRVAVSCGGSIFIRFSNENVFGESNNVLYDMKNYAFKNTDSPTDTAHTLAGCRAGKWFNVSAHQKYPIEILMESGAGGEFYHCIMIEERTPEVPYPRTYLSQLYPQDPVTYCYPIFAMKKGISIPSYDKCKEDMQKRIEAFAAAPVPADFTPKMKADWRPWQIMPQALPAQVIFSAE